MAKLINPAMVGQSDQQKVNECKAAIDQVLQTYGCQLVPFFSVVGGQMQQGTNIVPQPRLTPEQEEALKKEMANRTDGLSTGG
jgi:hypothetical protein